MTSRQEPSLKQETLSSLIWKLFERGGNAVVQLAVQIVMARLLAPEEFGALAIILLIWKLLRLRQFLWVTNPFPAT